MGTELVERIPLCERDSVLFQKKVHTTPGIGIPSISLQSDFMLSPAPPRTPFVGIIIDGNYIRFRFKESQKKKKKKGRKEERKRKKEENEKFPTFNPLGTLVQ